MPPGSDISFFVGGGDGDVHSLHTPDTSYAEGAEGSEEIFLVDWDAVGLGVVFWGLEEAETDLGMEDADFEDGTEADACGWCHVCHCVEDHLCGFEETAICEGA